MGADGVGGVSIRLPIRRLPSGTGLVCAAATGSTASPLWRTKTKQRALERLIPSAKREEFRDVCTLLLRVRREYLCGAELLRQLQQRIFWM